MDTPQIVNWDEILKQWQRDIRSGAVQELSDEQYARLIFQRDAERTRQTFQHMADTLAQFKLDQQPEQQHQPTDGYIPLIMGDTARS